MATLDINAASRDLAGAIEMAQREVVSLTQHGRLAAVLVSAERDEELLAALQEADDVAAFDAAMYEAGADIPWDR